MQKIRKEREREREGARNSRFKSGTESPNTGPQSHQWVQEVKFGTCGCRIELTNSKLVGSEGETKM